MPAALAPDRILKELADLWVSLGKQGESEGGAGVLRACSMTLVVLAEESEDVAALGETMAALMPEHPARTILIRLRGAGERTLADRVYAQCWMPFGQRRQICCEQIEITASDVALADLASVVLPLAVPDLPLIVWCRSPRLVAMPEFRDISAMAQKVVLDTSAMPDGPAAMHQLANLSERGVLLGDLSWTRLTRWREMLSQVFENRSYLALLDQVSTVKVSFGGRYQVPAWYMGTWVVNALAHAGLHADLSVAGESGDSFLRLEVAGAGLRVVLARTQDRLDITVNDFSNCTNLPQPTDYLLIREELGIVRHDPVFETTLASSARLAYPTNK
ncbi:MAG TPA: glucose-6-phosphate dehydrogenase assembly protein OpcA [Bryobacteraceae bacterium]|jgi:glucose-6-phosphate dehydrogenase assembly protein OpcA